MFQPGRTPRIHACRQEPVTRVPSQLRPWPPGLNLSATSPFGGDVGSIGLTSLFAILGLLEDLPRPPGDAVAASPTDAAEDECCIVACALLQKALPIPLPA
mmetsp:Transcript_112763/g.313798  ORF Transcript_112763/g.313798 Transcript_112763/m.313798 type:complete len:101 (-) Transcript_112763:12-314(-)